PKMEREGSEARPKRPRGAKVRRPAAAAFALDETRRPYATLALLAVSLFFLLLVVFVARHRIGIVSSLDTDPWRVVTSPFVYVNTWYELVALLAIGIYGWRLELRHGPVAVIGMYVLGGVGGMALTAELDSTPFAYGGNGIA